jgi:hypothetical protein
MPIEALVGDIVCGSTTTSEGSYTVGVHAGFGPDLQEGCGAGGEQVMFRSGDRIAHETGTFHIGYLIQELDLTFGQAPPTPTPAATVTPPSRIVEDHPGGFFGSVTIDGRPVPDGTTIEALIGETVCSTATTEDSGYFLVVNNDFGSGTFYQEGCGRSGVTVTFRIGDLIAHERGAFAKFLGLELDLTFGRAPDLPSTGLRGGSASGSSPRLAGWLWALLGAGLIAAIAGLAGRRMAR